MKTSAWIFIPTLAALLLSACAPMPTDRGPVPVEDRRPTTSAPPQQPPPESAPPITSGEPRKPANSAVVNLVDRGWGLYRNKDYSGALATAERAQRIDARSPEVYLLMASAQLSLYQVALAEQVARKGLALATRGSAVHRKLQDLLSNIAAASR